MDDYVQKLIDEKADIAMFIHTWDAYNNNNIDSELLKHYFKMYILKNTAFCVEDFFKIVKWEKHRCNLSLIPTSDSYNEFGSSVTIKDFVCTDVESEIYWNNWHNNQPTYGLFKAIKVSDSDEELDDQEIKLSTYDIYEILHL